MADRPKRSSDLAEDVSALSATVRQLGVRLDAIAPVTPTVFRGFTDAHVISGTFLDFKLPFIGADLDPDELLNDDEQLIIPADAPRIWHMSFELLFDITAVLGPVTGTIQRLHTTGVLVQTASGPANGIEGRVDTHYYDGGGGPRTYKAEGRAVGVGLVVIQAGEDQEIELKASAFGETGSITSWTGNYSADVSLHSVA